MKENVSLTERIEALEAVVAELRASVTAFENASGLYASDAELASDKGDPVVKWPLRNWAGRNDVGKKFSECAPTFLDALAENLQYRADHPKAKPKQGQSQEEAEANARKYADWDRKDAARARSWARRIRSGKMPAPLDVGEFPGDVPAPSTFAAPKFDTPSFSAAPTAAPLYDDDSDIPFVHCMPDGALRLPRWERW